MTILRERLWLTHRKKLDIDYCPLCFEPVKWIYDEIVWIPCSREPVLIYPHKGTKIAVYKRELIHNCEIYSEHKIKELQPVWGHIPHVYHCSELRKGGSK